MEEQIIEQLGEIDKSINHLTTTMRNAFSGTPDSMGVVECGFSRIHDRMDRIADSLDQIANCLEEIARVKKDINGEKDETYQRKNK